ncbi:MAG: hypothetical protein ACOH5I_21365 [Oligoflexus sp.]
MPLGETRDHWNSNPGGKDWRGKFDLFDPTSPSIGYLEKVILPSIKVMAESIREAGAPIRPIRFDLGAELMDSMLYFPRQWNDLLAIVRHTLSTQYPDVAQHIVLSHNFCHHIALLLRLPGHKEYLERIHPSQIIDSEAQFLDRPGISDSARRLIGQYISSLDEMSLSQYLPLDIFNNGSDPRETTPDQVEAALVHHERNFIDEVLIAELGIKEDDIPVLHVGEFGMGWRGLVAPNVWDYASWVKNGAGDLLVNEHDQLIHAGIGIKGVIRYMSQSPTRYQSLLLWLGGKPYDVIGINPYSEGWYNHAAAEALGAYWWEHRQALPGKE